MIARREGGSVVGMLTPQRGPLAGLLALIVFASTAVALTARAPAPCAVWRNVDHPSRTRMIEADGRESAPTASRSRLEDPGDPGRDRASMNVR